MSDRNQKTSKSLQNEALQESRRRSLKLGLATATTAILATGTNPREPSAKDLPSSPRTTPFVEPLPVYKPKSSVSSLDPVPTREPGERECGRNPHQAFDRFPPARFYTLRVQEALHSFHRELPPQRVWGYDGMVPGPTLVGRYGEPVLLRVYNDLPRNALGPGSPEISTHLHNLHTPSESDGYAGDYYSREIFGPTLTKPGEYRDHHYPHCYAGVDVYPDTNGDPREALGTLWYHDHRMDYTAPNTYKGLSGFYLLFDEFDSGDENDPNPRALRLPSGVGEYDIPLVLHDKQFDSSGYLYFDPFDPDGFVGDKFCVNGKIQPYFQVERRKYRFRILDGGPSRFYELYLTYQDNVQSFTYIANDGNLLPAPLRMTKVRLGPAERADIVIDFSQFPIGAQLFLENRMRQRDGREPEGTTSRGTPLMRFDVVREPSRPDTSQVPAKLRELPPINRSEVVQRRTWRFGRLNEVWVVNDKLFDVNVPAAIVKRGTAEIWRLRTGGGWAHPIHIHLEHFRILSRNDKLPAPHERGRKDTVVLYPGDDVEIFVRFRDFTGKYMIHCHNTVHEDHSMMVRFDVE